MNTKEELAQQIERMIQLNSHAGFVEAFWENVKTYRTFEEAYQSVEDEYEGYYGITKYSSYDSFRRVRDRKKKY